MDGQRLSETIVELNRHHDRRLRPGPDPAERVPSAGRAGDG